MKFTDDRQSLAPGELMAEAVPRPSLQDFQPSPGPGTLVTGAAEGLASSIALAAAAPLPPCQASRLHVALGRLCFTVFNPPTKTLPFPPLPGARPLPRFEHTEETDSDLRASPFPAPSGLSGTILCDGRARPPSSRPALLRPVGKHSACLSPQVPSSPSSCFLCWSEQRHRGQQHSPQPTADQARAKLLQRCSARPLMP